MEKTKSPSLWVAKRPAANNRGAAEFASKVTVESELLLTIARPWITEVGCNTPRSASSNCQSQTKPAFTLKLENASTTATNVIIDFMNGLGDFELGGLESMQAR